MADDPGLRRLALGTLLAAFRGATPPGWASQLLADGLAGYTLFGFNVVDREQLAALTGTLRRVRPDGLIAIDEEGGDVTRLAHATGSPYPGNAALGAVGAPALTRRIYHAIGAELAAVGVTLNLAPTVDVNTAGENPVIGTRSFGSDPSLVCAHTAAAVVGLQSAGVAACAKHFPGHGATLADSHLALPTVDDPLPVVRARDLPPFAAAVGAGVRAIMTAHIRVPALTGDDPATFSSAALVDLLRHEYGFDGVVVTDALEMAGAVTAAGGIGPAAVRALRAGADLLCLGADVDAGLVARVTAEIVAAITDGTLPVARVEQAAERTAALAGATAMGAGATAAEPDLGYQVARRAIRVEGSLDGLTDPVVVQVQAATTIAAGRVPWGLAPHLPPGTPLVRFDPTAGSPAELAGLAGLRTNRSVIVVGRHLHRGPTARAVVERLAADHPCVVVEMGWPSSWRPAGARAFLVTYGASHANGAAAAHVLGLR